MNKSVPQGSPSVLQYGNLESVYVIAGQGSINWVYPN